METRYKDLASYQFVDKINSLMSKQYSEDCKKFSLRDKARVRKMTEDAVARAKEARQEVKHLKVIKQETESECEAVKNVIEQNERIKQDVDALANRLAAEENVSLEAQEFKKDLLKKLEGAKIEFSKLVNKKGQKEKALEERCNEALRVLSSTRDELKQQVESLETQMETKKLQETISIETENQRYKAEGSLLDGQLKDYDIKMEQLKFHSRQYMQEKEKEQALIKQQWDQLQKERDRLAQTLEELKQEDKDKEDQIRRLKERIKGLEQDENIVNFDIECKLRNEKYGLSNRKAAKSEATRADYDSPLASPSNKESSDDIDKQLDEVVCQAKAKLRRMAEVVGMMLEMNNIQQSGTGEPGSVQSRDVETIRSNVGQIIREIFED